jgi:integrase
VTPAGAKSWVLLYRVASGAKLRRLTIGAYPDLGLSKARDKARGELRKAQAGRDPGTERQTARKHTFQALADDYIEKHAKRHKRSWREDDRRLRNVLVPAWGERPVTAIRRADVRELLEDIVTRGKSVDANRTLALVRRVLNYALDAEWVEANVAAKLQRPGGAEASRARVLNHDELRATWQHLQAPSTLLGLKGRQSTLARAALSLRLVTAQRGVEVLNLRWSDIDGDWWTIPAESSKNKLPHRVFLSRMAQDILTRVRTLQPDDSVYAFVGVRGKRQRSRALDDLGIADVRPHDFRRTAASMMASAGIARLVVAKVLNHVDRGVTAIYDRHSYDAEKRVALETWDRTLTATLEEKPAGTVVPFARS